MEIFFKEFNELVLKALITVMVSTQKFCGVSEKFLIEFRVWINDTDNFAWLLKKRKEWEDTK